MTGIIAELILSWLLLWLICKKNLSALGFTPTAARWRHLVTGFLSAALVCTIYHLLSSFSAHNSWAFNKQATVASILSSAWWTFKSVLFEELIFRGALLYILIEKAGAKIACILSAVCFGVYHWFSYGVFNQPVQMLFIFLMTGIFGLMLAFAFARTRSLYLPVGLHLGWNLANIVIFSNGPLGQQLLIPANENRPQGIPSLLLFLFQVLALPVITYLYFRKRGESV